MKIPKAYICSPYKSKTAHGVLNNVKVALHMAIVATRYKLIPIVPHIVVSAMLKKKGIPYSHKNDFNLKTRKIAMKECLNLLDDCDTILINVSVPVTEGMKQEIRRAIKDKKTLLKYE